MKQLKAVLDHEAMFVWNPANLTDDIIITRCIYTWALFQNRTAGYFFVGGSYNEAAMCTVPDWLHEGNGIYSINKAFQQYLKKWS